MNQSESIDGRWWISGPDHPPLQGVLDLSAGSLRLNVKVGGANSEKEVVFAMVGQTEYTAPAVIVGRDESDGPITLYGCLCIGDSVSTGQRHYVIEAVCALRQISIATWDTPVVRAVLLHPDYLYHWINVPFIKAVKTATGEDAIGLSAPLDSVYLVDAGIKLRIHVSTSISHERDSYSAKPHAQLWLHFDVAKAPREITDYWIPWISRFLGLVIGMPVRCRNTSFFLEDPYFPTGKGPVEEGALLRRGEIRSSPLRFHETAAIASFKSIKDTFESVLQRWNALVQSQKPVVDIFGSVALSRHLHREAEFLFLVQALEMYHSSSGRFDSHREDPVAHRTKVKEALSKIPDELKPWANERLAPNWKHLQGKLEDLFHAHPSETLSLFESIPDAASRIAATRNKLVHHSSNPRAIRLLSDTEFTPCTRALLALLWLILSSEIGLPKSAYAKIVKNCTDSDIVRL